jgi:MFS family permease
MKDYLRNMSFTSGPAWRDVYIASSARAVSYAGEFLAATALALTLQTRGDHGYGVAALLIASTLPLALLGPTAGRIADRVDSRVLLIITSIGQAAVCAVLAFTEKPAMMIALVALVSAGLALTQPTLSALVPEMVGKENLPKAMSISQTAGAVGMLAGPMLGGLLFGAYGMRLPLLLDAASYLAIAVAGAVIRTRRGGRAATTPAAETKADGGPSWRLRHDRLLMTLISAFAAVIAAITAVNVVEIFFVRETLHASPAMYGLVSGVWTLGVLCGAMPFGKVRGDDRRLGLLLLVLMAGVSAIVLASSGVPNAGWLIVLYLAGGGLNAGLNVLAGVVVGRRAPDAIRGRVFGVFTAVANSANLVGYLAGGLLLPLVAPRTLLAATGALGLVIAVVFIVSMGRTPVARSEPAPVS